MSGEAARIDAGVVAAKLSALIGGSRAQEDRGVVEAAFLDANGAELGKVAIRPLSRDERKMTTKLLPKQASAAVPKGTRSVRVAMAAQRVTGSYIDAFFDNLSLTLAEQPLQASLTAKAACGAGQKSVAAERGAVAGVQIASVAFSVTGGARIVDAAAPFAAKLPLATRAKRAVVKALVADATGRSVTLTKTVRCA